MKHVAHTASGPHHARPCASEPGVHKDGAAQSIYQDLLATFFTDPAEAADRQVGGKAKAMGKANPIPIAQKRSTAKRARAL